MTVIEELRREVGQRFVGSLWVPSLVKGEERVLVVVKPTPAELLFKTVHEREREEHKLVGGAGTLVYKEISIDRILNELYFGDNLDVFVAFSNRDNLQEGVVDEDFRLVFELLFDGFDKIIGEVNNKNFISSLLERAESLKGAGDALYLYNQHLSDEEDAGKLIRDFNEMNFLKSFMSYILDGSTYSYEPKSVESVNYNAVHGEVVQFEKTLEVVKNDKKVYVQLDWEPNTVRWLNYINSSTLRSISATLN